MTELEVELEKIVPVSLPLYVVAWLQEKVDRIKEKNPRVRVGIGTIAKAIIITHYEEETGTGKKKETSDKKSASTPAPGKELRPEEKAESENTIMNEETIRRDIVLPKQIARHALMKMLQRKGYDAKRARQVIDLLVVNGIYREEDGLLILQEGKK